MDDHESVKCAFCPLAGAECPEFVDGRCRLCGCRLGLKVRMAAEHCPIDKW